MRKVFYIWFLRALLLCALIIISGCQATEEEPTEQVLGEIEGTVTDVNGRAIAGMRVSIVSGTTGFPEILAMTNDSGYYKIGSVPSGSFDVAVHDLEGNRVDLRTVTIREGETATLDFAIPATVVSGEEEEPSDPQIAEEWMADGVFGYREYFAEMVSGDGNYELRWSADEQYLYIGIRAKTTGWVAIGFHPSSKMKDADMLFGFVQNGATIVSDRFSTGVYGPHPPDTELGGTDDIIEYGGKEEDGHTTIEFKRALNTGDLYDHELKSGSISIIWSYGSSDEPTEKHASRGYGEITI